MFVTTKLAALSSIDMFYNFRHCLKSQTFSDSCAQNRYDLLAKVVKHIDGTSGAKRGCNTDWTLVRSTVQS